MTQYLWIGIWGIGVIKRQKNQTQVNTEFEFSFLLFSGQEMQVSWSFYVANNNLIVLISQHIKDNYLWRSFELSHLFNNINNKGVWIPHFGLCESILGTIEERRFDSYPNPHFWYFICAHQVSWKPNLSLVGVNSPIDNSTHFGVNSIFWGVQFQL